MFNTDKPINKISDDKLGRSSFARQLANSIIQFDTKDNYSISLQGKWGCGKTSVLNMAIEEIKHLTESVDEKKKIIIVQFNPWNFTDTSQLISQFFVTLTNSLKFDNTQEKTKNVGAAIEKYSSALEYSEYIPVVGKYLKLLPKLSSAFGKTIKDNADSKINDVSYRKGEVETALKDLEARILVVIDDIDRLSNEQIRLIFQLVSSVAGLPNITYLLSFDKDIVARALGDVQRCDGGEYLEKIIQVPFDVPPLDISKVHNILFEKLDALIELHNGMEFDKKHWSNVFSSCISPFVKTLRDINRFCNALAFMYAAVKEEVDFIDMAGISALRVFASPIFEWVRENKFSLIGGYSGGGVVLNELNKRKEETLQSFKEIYPQNTKIMLDAVASLFPVFSNQISYPSSYMTSNEIHQAMRIASDSRFDLYFSLSLDKVKISRREIDDSLLHMEENALRLYVNTLNRRELFGDFVAEVKKNLSRIPEDRVELLLSVLVFHSGRIAENKPKLIGADSEVISVYTISDLLFRINDENFRYDVISNMLSNTDFLSFQFLLHLLHIIELTHGRVAETNYINEPKLVSLGHLHELEVIFLERTKNFIGSTDLFDWKEARRASFLWEFIEEPSYSEYIGNLLKVDLFVPKYLATKVSKWHSSDGTTGYEYSDNTYEKYISADKVVDIINSLRLSKKFWELDDERLACSAAFVLSQQCVTKSKRELDNIVITELLNKWRLDADV